VTFLCPFTRHMVNRIGGPLRAHKLNSIATILSSFIKFLAGFVGSRKNQYISKFTITRIAIIFTVDTVCTIFNMMDTFSGQLMNYQMLDYVELQTGVRSEGITFAVNNLFTKIVTNNLGSLTGNGFLQWTGYTGGYDEERDANNKVLRIRPWSEYYPLVPLRMKKYMWPMATLAPVVDNAIWLLARSLVHYTPEQALETEVQLAQRRAAKKAAEAEKDVVTAGETL